MPQNAEKDTTGIWFEMDSETNRKLEESASSTSEQNGKKRAFD